MEEDFLAAGRVERELWPVLLEVDFFAEVLPVEDARPVVRLEDARPEDDPAVRPVDLADELRVELARPEVPEADLFAEVDFAADLRAIERECDLELGLEFARLDVRPAREALPVDFAFSG